MTFGFRRAEILAAQANGITLLLLGRADRGRGGPAPECPARRRRGDRRRDGPRRCRVNVLALRQVARANRAESERRGLLPPPADRSLRLRGHRGRRRRHLGDRLPAGRRDRLARRRRLDALGGLAARPPQRQRAARGGAGGPRARRDRRRVRALTAASPTSTTCTSGRSARASPPSRRTCSSAAARTATASAASSRPSSTSDSGSTTRRSRSSTRRTACSISPCESTRTAKFGPRAAPTTARAQQFRFGGIGASQIFGSAGPFFCLAKRSTRRHGVTKYKLEYIWLDGYEPVPNLRSKTKIEAFTVAPTLEDLPIWGFDGSSTRQAEGSQLGLPAAAGRALPRPGPRQRDARDVRGAAPGRDAASVEQPRDDPGRPRHVVRLRAGVLPLPRRRAARLPARRASRRRRASTTRASASRTSATSRARSSRRTSTSASRRASTSRASTPRWPRASGSSRSSARARSGPPTRCGSRATCCCASARATASTSTSTPSRSAWSTTGTAPGMHTNFSTEHMREVGGEDVLRGADGRVRRAQGRAHRRLRPRQPHAADGAARDAGDRQVQLRRREPRCVDPRSRTASSTTATAGYLEDRRPNSLGDPYQIAGRILQTIETVPTDAADVSVDEAAAVAA